MAEKKQKKEITLTRQQVLEAHEAERMKLAAIDQRAREVEVLLMQAENAQLAINALKNEKESQALIPLGAGAYVECTTKNVQVKRMIGTNVIVNTTLEEIQKNLEANKKLFQEELTRVQAEHNKTVQNLREIEQILQAAERAQHATAQKK
ncbi:MAG: hypothetical protein HY393_03645 [Candidatus Diapherotrites archaeon]|nr:hypothetical protein [Candidatus Diapherotrites archaeon]